MTIEEIDKEIKTLEETRFYLQMKDHWTGERMWDVSKAIDALAEFPKCDTDKIFITGNSGGGTMSFYAACYDEGEYLI